MSEFVYDPDELFVPSGPKAPDFSWKMVTCVKCRKTYRCTPNSDYFTTVRFTRPKDDQSGFCWDCLNIVTGLTGQRAAAGKDAQPEPELGDEYTMLDEG